MKMNITQTWTYNHKHLIITLSLATALVAQSGILTPYIPTLHAETVTYQKTEPATLDEIVEARAVELHEARTQFDLEMYRQEAIREINAELMTLSTTSPFIDYAALKEQFGY
jgi:hypothetical protein